jgi:hypothetical protein
MLMEVLSQVVEAAVALEEDLMVQETEEMGLLLQE